mgnify:CR=1 FL=1
MNIHCGEFVLLKNGEIGIDYCVVAVPTIYHEEVGMALAAAGVHALIEKPIAPDVASATRLVEAFEANGQYSVGKIQKK